LFALIDGGNHPAFGYGFVAADEVWLLRERGFALKEKKEEKCRK
jgi:hypothetical protein